MKKTLLTLILLTMGLAGFSQNDSINYNFSRDRIFKKIDTERTFKKDFFCEYIVKSDSSGNKKEFVTDYYNFNLSDEYDLVVCFKPNNPLAEIVMMNLKENSPYNPNLPITFEFTYIDNNGDGILEERVPDIHNWKPESLTKEKIETLKREYEKKEFERRYKEYIKSQGESDI